MKQETFRQIYSRTWRKKESLCFISDGGAETRQHIFSVVKHHVSGSVCFLLIRLRSSSLSPLVCLAPPLRRRQPQTAGVDWSCRAPSPAHGQRRASRVTLRPLTAAADALSHRKEAPPPGDQHRDCCVTAVGPKKLRPK